MDEWKGTRKELINVIDYIMNDIKETYYNDVNITDKDFSKLFLEAFTRNTVQNELIEAMAYIHENEINV